MWLAVHLIALTGFKNRARGRVRLGRRVPWARAVQRAITTQQVFARQVRKLQAAAVKREAAPFRSSSRS